MIQLFVRIYDYFAQKAFTRYAILVTLTVVLTGLVSRLGYKEDISDFIPFGGRHATALRMYQNISGASKIFVLFRQADGEEADPDRLVEAADKYVEQLEESALAKDSLHVVSTVDIDLLDNFLAFVYGNIPYLLQDEDYDRIDSLLASPGFVARQLDEDKRMLMFPSGGILSANLGRDPLNLFTPVAERMSNGSASVSYENYDEHIFTPDMLTAIVMIDTPYGASESESNSRLTAGLKQVAEQTKEVCSGVDIDLAGSPVIAVGNANQIKQDSLISISAAVVLILALLLYVFRSKRNILMIGISITWGWLFALASLSLLHDKVSIIVVGISSVILGIAVNYPLHIIAHISHDSRKRNAFKEIVPPLLVGNITTIGAFLALVPLQSVALRDLGLFASFLLLGTILFSLIFLPHIIREGVTAHSTFIDRMCNWNLETKPWLIVTIGLLTLILGYYSLDTRFDSNMTHINYMSEKDRATMDYFQQMLNEDSASMRMYALVSDPDLQKAIGKSEEVRKALDELQKEGSITSYNTCTNMVCSDAEQKHRLERWNRFVEQFYRQTDAALKESSQAMGFVEDSFADFYDMLDKTYTAQEADAFMPMLNALYAGYILQDETTGEYHVVSTLNLNKDNYASVEGSLSSADVFCFSMNSINSAIADNLSDNFNYIGWACGFIVFFFLWLSMGSIELALISFAPMAVSWIWILGFMAIFDVQFNIVNIILATFIFGQGDDYTIFMTEGASYEYTHRRKILNSYKHSIIVSAIIMFVGIGSLIVAKHPAMHSLAEVTIIGMFVVVLMAYLLPSLLFKWLTTTHGSYRTRPLTLRRLLISGYAAALFFVQLAIAYLYGLMLCVVQKDEQKRRWRLHKFVHKQFKFDSRHIPGIQFCTDCKELDSGQPCMIVSNHQSMLDSAIYMALSPKTILISNYKASNHRPIKTMFKWLGFVTLSDDLDTVITQSRQRMDEGYNIVIFPEGKRNSGSSILRFHKGTFLMAEQLNADIQPVIMHGVNDVFPRDALTLFEGTIMVKAMKRISHSDASWGTNYSERTKAIHQLYCQQYEDLKKHIETYDYYKSFVLDRYRYKEKEIVDAVKRNLKAGYNHTDISVREDGTYIRESGYGERALIYALSHADEQVTACMPDEEKAAVLRYSAEGVAKNLVIIN